MLLGILATVFFLTMAINHKNEVTLGFTSLCNEVCDTRLRIDGTIPHWLAGTLIRNGPAKFEIGQRQMNHWFDGLAMLHAFECRAGEVFYTNKFIRGNTFAAAQNGKRVFSEFATDPCGGIFRRTFTKLFKASDNTNVNIIQLKNRFLALTETPVAVEFSCKTLVLLCYKELPRSQAAETISRTGYPEVIWVVLREAHYRNRRMP
jgi:beta,beta-carotene 9',10'-dioxygenase